MSARRSPVVLDEIAVVTRSGAVSRRPETSSVASALVAHRPLARIEGLRVHRIALTEFVKAEAGVTCCSLLVRGT